MTYLNVSLAGLRGRHHPALSGIIQTWEVKNARIHLKMLSGDYLTFSIKANQSGGSPNCRSCSPLEPQKEEIFHILAVCEKYSDIRKRMLPGFRMFCQQSLSKIDFEEISSDMNTLTQFILDPSSLNLKVRVNVSDPILPSIFRLSRDYCNAIHTKRMNIIKAKEQEQD